MGIAQEVTRQLPIPPLFLTLLAGLLVVGLLLTLVIAWGYERVGKGGDGAAPAGR